MNDHERRVAIALHAEKLREDIWFAEDGLQKIAAGRKHYELDGDKDMADVTDERADQMRSIVEKSNRILAQYEQWDA